jgi:hypothetical protein
MSILEPKTIEPHDAAALAAVIAQAAGAGNWGAAAWMLQHDPEHRKLWGDREQIRTAVDAELGKVATGIERSGLTTEQQRIIILSLRAAGVGVP